MTIDLASGEIEPTPVILEEAFVAHRERTAVDLEDGEICYVDTEALWVHPETRALHIDGQYTVYPCEDTVTDGIHMMTIARLMRYQGLLVVDVSHIAEVMRTTQGSIDDLRFCTVDARRLAKFEQESVVIDGAFITGSLELMLFTDLWVSEYGQSEDIGFIDVMESITADEDDGME